MGLHARERRRRQPRARSARPSARTANRSSSPKARAPNRSATPPARRSSPATARPPAAPSCGSIYEGENGKRAQLRAYGAIPEGGTLPLLWSGKIGTASKFSVPTASEGRVYVGTRNGNLDAFGSSSHGPAAGGAGRIRDRRRGARPDRPAVARGSPRAASDGADRRHRRGTAGAPGRPPATRPCSTASRPGPRRSRPASPRSARACWRSSSPARRPPRRRAEPGGERVLQARTPGADRGAAAGAHERRHEDGPGQRLRQRTRPDPLGAPARTSARSRPTPAAST